MKDFIRFCLAATFGASSATLCWGIAHHLWEWVAIDAFFVAVTLVFLIRSLWREWVLNYKPRFTNHGTRLTAVVFVLLTFPTRPAAAQLAQYTQWSVGSLTALLPDPDITPGATRAVNWVAVYVSMPQPEREAK
jgi:hypothetical protein